MYFFIVYFAKVQVVVYSNLTIGDMNLYKVMYSCVDE